MPCTEGLEEREGLWECANEACPEFGQVVDVEPPRDGCPRTARGTVRGRGRAIVHGLH
jgi:hypothetical protein